MDNNKEKRNQNCSEICASISSSSLSSRMFKFGSKKHQTEVKNERIVDYDQHGGTLLYKSIEERQWKSTLTRMTMSPHEVSTFIYRSGKGAEYQSMILPLHAALKLHPPTIIISALIAAYPKAVSQKCDGDLPLHVSVRNGASLDVIQNLVLAFPSALDEKDSNGMDPMDIFNQCQSLWWKNNDDEKEAIAKLLDDGIDNIVLQERKSKVMRSFKESVKDLKMVNGNAASDAGVAADGSAVYPEVLNMFQSEAEEEVQKQKEILSTQLREEGWLVSSGLAIIVIGASGDLAKKKTYPSLLRLYHDRLLPPTTVIWGFARSQITHQDLRKRLRPYLENGNKYPPKTIDGFLSQCFYQRGSSYGDQSAYRSLSISIGKHESKLETLICHNRLFYFAIPPNVFEETGVAIKDNAMAGKGWTRVIIEKPFGRDLQSCEELLGTLSKTFEEEQMFRIDHYLGKEMVQNLIMMRFGNLWFERLWNRDNIECVMFTFKEPFGTDGRGGYFDKYGIIRDIIQNHLLQVLTLLAMEAPSTVDGSEAGESIRDAKVKVLSAIPPITLDDCFLGQYEGYTDDPTIKNKDTNTPTFAILRCFVNTPRWAGVPFIFKAGKALNERKAEMRIQFKDAPAASFMFESKCPRNELVMRLQPDEAIYIKTNVKTPGFSSDLIQKELEVNYKDRFDDEEPDAYTRLILDVLRGRSATFVRSDELIRAWEVFTPVLHRIEREKVRPHTYMTGSRGPEGADEFVFEKSGYVRNEDYVFHKGERKLKSNL